MAKFTKAELLSGDLDLRKTTLLDIAAFIEENGLLETYSIDPDKTKKVICNELCDMLEEAKPEQEAPAEKEQKADDEPVIEESKGTEAPNPKEPPFLARRAPQIKAAKEESNIEPGKVNPAKYGDDAPDYLKRRFGTAK